MGMFVKLPKHKRFDIQPRYWDPEAEAKKEREKRIRAELGLKEDGDEYVPDVRAGLRQEYARRKAERGGGKMINAFRFFIILMVLLVVFFYLVAYKMEDILDWFY